MELKRPYSIAYKTVSKVESVFVIIATSNGYFGIGAANPSKAVVGHDVSDTFKILEALRDQLVGRSIPSLPAAIKLVQELTAGLTGPLTALDIALHDLFSKAAGVPLADFYGRYFDKMPTSITVGIKNVKETLEEAREYLDMGFRYLKVKLGNNLEEDIERLAKLREEYGSSIHIRVDANQGYSMEALKTFFHATQSFDLELIEQPVPEADTLLAAALPNEIKKSLAADEYLKTSADALALVNAKGACGIFNIKLMKSGGINEARHIAHIAQLRHIDLMWGCNDESIVSISAALHTALSTPTTKYLDLDGSLDLARDVVSGGFHLENGVLHLLDEPGLGVELIH